MTKSPPEQGAPSEDPSFFLDRRRHFRVDVPLKARFLGADGIEHPCLVSNISASGALLRTKTPPKIDDRVIVYIDRLGRFEGYVIRAGQNSFAVCYERKRARTQKTADDLTEIINNGKISHDRRASPRIRHDAPALIRLESGEEISCAILDISLTGASLEISPRPPLGANLVIGKMAAKVVRRHDKGVGVVFTGKADHIEEVITETTYKEEVETTDPTTPPSFGKRR